MNSKTIPQPSSNKLYVAHSVKFLDKKNAPVEKTKTVDKSVSPASSQPFLYTSRSYYYDSMGGGYQGL